MRRFAWCRTTPPSSSGFSPAFSQTCLAISGSCGGGPAEDAQALLLERAFAALDPDRVGHLRHRAPDHRADPGVLVGDHHGSAGAVADQHAGGAVGPVGPVAELLDADHQRPSRRRRPGWPGRRWPARTRTRSMRCSGRSRPGCRGRAGRRHGRRCSANGRSPYRWRRPRSRSRRRPGRRSRSPCRRPARPSRRPDSSGAAIRRSRMPTRLWIHSSLVSTMVASSSLVSTRSGW